MSKERIYSFQALRALASVSIFLYHFSFFSSKTRLLSYFLDIFFILSSFLVLYNSDGKNDEKGFLIRKLIRILPLYYILTIATYIGAQFFSFLGYKPTFEMLVKSLLFIPFSRNSVKSSIQIRPIHGSGRTLQIEIVFYVLYFVLYKLFKNQKKRNITSFVILLLLSISCIFVDNTVLSNNIFIRYYLIDSKSMWFSLMVGCVAFFTYKYLNKYFDLVTYLLLFVSIVLLFIDINNRYYFDILFLGIVMLSLVLHEKKVKIWEPLIFIGDLSSSFYLIHYYVVTISEKLFSFGKMSLLTTLVIIATYAVSILASYISNKYFESKINRYLLGKLKY